MNTVSKSYQFTTGAMLRALLTTFGFLAVFAGDIEAQVGAKDKAARRESIKVSGYTRPGNPSDLRKDGELIRLGAFEGELKKFKVMGATVYFAVFKNTHLFDDTRIVEGDTFGTGLSLDGKFEPGGSFPDSTSPRFDRKAKYLYLYQIVNDRSLDPRLIQAKGTKGGVSWPIFDPKKVDPKAEVPVTDDIASIALKLLVDPRYMTSWGHFHDAGFAANVVDEDVAGNPVKNIVEEGPKKFEVDREIRLAFSYMPAIVTKISDPAFNRRARSHPLGKLETAFGVDNASVNLKQTKAYGDLSNVVGKIGADNARFASFVEGLVKAAGAAKEPDVVQLLSATDEERRSAGDENATRAVFRVDWRKDNSLKQGYRSVVFGFTTDLAPMSAPLRIDTPDGVKAREGVRLKDYFNEDDDDGRAAQAAVMAMIFTGLVENGNAQEFVLAQAQAALSPSTAFGQAATPIPPPPAPPGGGPFAGGGGAGGGLPSGGLGLPASGFGLPNGGGFGIPALFGGIPARGSGLGGIGFGSAVSGSSTSSGQTTSNEMQTQQNTQTGATMTINFNTSLTNQQAQQQQQRQFQIQRGRQHQSQHSSSGHHHPVVPAPASLLLGLLGLPALLLFLRRNNAQTPPTP